MRFIDLSHPMRDGQGAFPGDPILRITSHCTTSDEAGYNLSRLELGSHHGTHLDAMFHFRDDGKTIEQMPLEWFYGPARVLRIPKSPRAEITVEDFAPYEAFLVPGARIICATGWHRRYGEGAYFEAYPSLTIEAALYLAARRIRLLGMDTPSPSRDYYEVHNILMAPEIVIVESLANLDQVPDEFVFAGFPLHLAGCDGSPIRAVAIVDD